MSKENLENKDSRLSRQPLDRVQASRTTSIARRLNASFWLKRAADALLFDLLAAAGIIGAFAFYCLENDISLNSKECFEQLRQLWSYAWIPCIVVVSFQAVHLFFSFFSTAKIRRMLKPLNDLAVRAEQLSNSSMGTVELQGDGADKFESLEHAIESVSIESSEMRIQTGDKDLQSIEIALNNLLGRMRDSQRQQTRFVSDASHELRTPIAVVQGYVNMLDRWGKNDKAVLDESIAALKTETEHMKELVEQLLFLARGDSGRNTLNKSRVDLHELLSEVCEESSMIDAKHNYVLKGSEALVSGDVAMLKQSMRILVQNAAKYSPDGGDITLSTKVEHESAAYVIQDEGIGIDENEISHIFERFYRSDDARGKNGGSGLGLSIAKWIIDAHDGTIDVISKPSLGSRFTVSFPRLVCRSQNNSA